MASKFDEYLKQGNFTPQEKDAMAQAGATIRQANNGIESPSPTPGAKVNTEQPKLDERIADRIQSTGAGEGNNYQAQEGSLSKYPTSQGGAGKPQEKPLDKEPEQ